MNREKEKGLEQYFFRASAEDFKKIPGSPIAYWAPASISESFGYLPKFKEFGETLQGMTTCDNDFYLRYWFEVDKARIKYNSQSREDARQSGTKWFPYTKGGARRKWYGNNEYVINWENDGEMLQTKLHPTVDKVWAHNFNLGYIFREGVTYSSLSSGGFSCRYTPKGFLFDQKGSMIFVNKGSVKSSVGLLNSILTSNFLSYLCPTLDFNPGAILKIPVANDALVENDQSTIDELVAIGKKDWDEYETSWDFITLPFISDHRQGSLQAAYPKLRTHWQAMTQEMQRLEQENNRIFIEAYGLQAELSPDVPLKEITLTSNPHYRYGGNKSDEELESLLLADTMKEVISYVVGCMFGRYALEKPGLILANQGETIDDYLKQIPEPSFFADDDNVIPMLDGDWFTDDITERFFKFLRVTFGDEHYEDNLKFIEQAIGKDVRKYFLKDFYSDHVKRYKKRPIYWMFSSPKGSFNALIYMHRYRSDTISVILNDYLREFRSKLTARKNHLEAVSISASASQSEKTKALKETDKLNKMIAEMEEYERDVLYPLATEQVEIDLDDGVKVNYAKFGKALKKIAGLN